MDDVTEPTSAARRPRSPKCFRPWCGVGGKFCIDCKPLQQRREPPMDAGPTMTSSEALAATAGANTTATTDSPFDYAYFQAHNLTLWTLEPGVEYTLVRNRDGSDAGMAECFFAMQDDAACYVSRLEAAFAAGGLGEPKALDLAIFKVRRV